jgi:adenylate kinase
MRVLMIAPPGAGKGTQGALIATHFTIPHIATGNLLREHVAQRTALGLAVQRDLDRGELVADSVVLDMVREALLAVRESGASYVLDGVPRTMAQARALYQIARELDLVSNLALHLKASDEELVRRLLARAAIERRTDDTEAVIRRRLAIYHEVTQPIVAWYEQRGILLSVDAMRPIEQVGREILVALEALSPLVDLVPEELRRPIDLTGLDVTFGEPPYGALTDTGTPPEP